VASGPVHRGIVETPVAAPADANDDAEHDAKRLIGTIVAERYKVEALLGEGGMGAVYRARHVHMHKQVALKVLHKEMTQLPEAVARFEREAVAGARIEHANVAAATDFGRLEDGTFYLVLEFVEGKSLRDVLEVERALSASRCARVFRQIASALGAAHKLGIVHRDLKPENIMLVDRPGEPDFVKVLDFGIAKLTVDAAQPALTRLGAVFGTPDYMSPEQALGKTVDHRSDLYSVGVMLYEACAGQRPFDDDQAVNVLAAQIGKQPPPLPEEIHPLLANLVRTLLAKNPDDRPQTAADVVKAFEEMSLVPAFASASSPRLNSSPAIEVGGLASVGIGSSILSQPDVVITNLPEGSTPGPISGVHPTALAVPASTGATAVRGPSGAQVYGRKAIDFARALWLRAEPELQRPIKLGTVTAPAGLVLAVPLAGLVGLVLLILIITAITRPTLKPAIAALSGVEGWSAPVAPAAPRASVERRTVTPKDVERIEGVAIYKRKLEDWLDLGRGYAAMGRAKDSALAYRAALQLDKAPRNDPQMLADLREVAASPDAYGLVVNVSEGGGRGLGDAGYELMWDLWQDFLGKPELMGQAESTFKKLVIVSRRTSPSLRVAIELHAAKECDPVPEILERAVKYADERALARLRQMQETTGCGADKGDDCWRCLRGSESLATALKNAEARPAPKMEKGYR
jgi:eukaryotic-like serine/threonine-protein kinase